MTEAIPKRSKPKSHNIVNVTFESHSDSRYDMCRAFHATTCLHALAEDQEYLGS